jgi:hypothetical protein
VAPRICTSCDVPHVTSDWYVVAEHKHPLRGEVECREAHEDRIRREVRDASQTALKPSHN